MENIDIGILVTVAIFAVSNIITLVRSYVDRKNSIANLKKMFIQELVMNFQWMDNAMPNGKFPKPENVKVAASIFPDLETFIFDKYLSQLLILSEREVRSIYDAYASIRHTVNFLVLPNSNYDKETKFRGMTMPQYEEALKILLRITYTNITDALALIDGSDFRSRLPYEKFPSMLKLDDKSNEQG